MASLLQTTLRATVAAIVCALATVVCAADAVRLDEMWFEKVEPIIDRNCAKCHGGVRQRSGLDARSLENLLRGGDMGPAIEPGSPEDSLLYQFIQVDADVHMPPDEGKQLTPDEIESIREWIAALPPPGDVLPDVDFADPSWPRQYAQALEARRPRGWTPPDDASPVDVIDGFVRRRLEREGISSVGKADDATLVRRIYLDLAGRIPTTAEVDTFMSSDAADRVDRLIDQLLSSPEYARRMREVFDVVLMGRPPGEAERRGPPLADRRGSSGWYEYLETSFANNRSWDEMVRDMIVARPDSPEKRGAVWFLYERRNDHQKMAEAIGPLAFGMRFDCAQCHNHPLAWEVEQRHYWALVTALNRSTAVDAKDGPGMAESAVGGFISFADVDKKTQPAVMTFMNGKTIEEERPERGQKIEESPDLYIIPPPKRDENNRGRRRGRRPEIQKVEQPYVPKFSRRAELAEAVTRGNERLSRAFVNRIWALFMGRGLVHPVDQMDSKHRPSHPELLEWLSNDFEQHGYDIKRLIRSIMLSRTYQLDSRWPGDGPAPAVDTLARAIEKPLSAEQLYHSLLIATGAQPDAEGKIAGRPQKEILEAFTTTFPDLFAEQYNATVMQSLFLSNSPIVEDLLRPTESNTTGELLALASNSERIDAAFKKVLGRAPDADEREQFEAYLGERSPEAGTRQMLWALLTSAEFLVNH